MSTFDEIYKIFKDRKYDMVKLKNVIAKCEEALIRNKNNNKELKFLEKLKNKGKPYDVKKYNTLIEQINMDDMKKFFYQLKLQRKC